jgi:hypothetical protein
METNFPKLPEIPMPDEAGNYESEVIILLIVMLAVAVACFVGLFMWIRCWIAVWVEAHFTIPVVGNEEPEIVASCPEIEDDTKKM